MFFLPEGDTISADLTPSYTWLDRPRLLRFLPEDPGYVLRMEAPFGFGKSVLLTQAAAHLAGQGLRVLRASGADPRHQLAAGLGLPAAASWENVLAAISRERTSLLLDDLSPDDDLDPLLAALPGPLVLASRASLTAPALLTLQAAGRLTSLTAEHLAFTRAEAAQLAGGPEEGGSLWADTLGWPLPLHLQTVGGGGSGALGNSAAGALRRGLAGSLSPGALEALRATAALDGLPLLPADPGPELRGLLGEAGRPSPLVRRLFGRGPETEGALRRVLGTLPPERRAEAYEHLGWQRDLAELLDTSPGLGQLAPEAFMRWDRLLPPGGPVRETEAAWALVRSGHPLAGARRFEGLARDPRATPQQRLDAYGNAVFYSAEGDLVAAQRLADEAEALLPGALPEDRALFLNRASHLDYLSGQLRRGVARLTQALELLPVVPRRRLRSNVAVNLAMQRWWLDGDSDAHMAVRERELNAWGEELPAAVRLMHRWNLGVSALLGGLPAEARRHFALALADGEAQPLYALHCRCYLALLEGRLEAMPALWAEVLSYADADSEDRVLCAWALELLRQDRAAEALRRTEGHQGELVGTVRALVLQRAGHPERALEALPPVPDPAAEREKSLYILSTRYRVTRDPRELDALCRLNTEGPRVLASFVPAAELPRTRPELSLHHPLQEVLASGWREAIALRLAEMPPLELRLLGPPEVRVLGQAVPLSGRPRDILILSALGHSREEIAEALWPGVGAEKSRNNLHVNLNQLRKDRALGVPTYLFEEGLRCCQCDLWEVQQALRRGDWAQVRRQYRPLLPGLTLGEVAEARSVLEAQVLAGGLAHASGLPPREAQDWLDWLLHLDPLHEGAVEQLLAALLASGQRHSAERRYEEYARRLKASLNLLPSQRMRRLLTPA